MVGVLAERFKLTQFKDWQMNAIKAVLSGLDALVVQPTGCGKSLCFQFPAVWLKKTAIVLTPTVSLMSDQTTSLTARGISATFLGSAQRDKSAQVLQYIGKHNPAHWSMCKTWSEWWTRPRHLSKFNNVCIFYAYI